MKHLFGSFFDAIDQNYKEKTEIARHRNELMRDKACLQREIFAAERAKFESRNYKENGYRVREEGGRFYVEKLVTHVSYGYLCAIRESSYKTIDGPLATKNEAFDAIDSLISPEQKYHYHR